MTDATHTPSDGPMLSADGIPLKKSLQIALRRQKLRALALIAPLLLFVLISFIAPIAEMLFRSVETISFTDHSGHVIGLAGWTSTRQSGDRNDV